MITKVGNILKIADIYQFNTNSSDDYLEGYDSYGGRIWKNNKYHSPNWSLLAKEDPSGKELNFEPIEKFKKNKKIYNMASKLVNGAYSPSYYDRVHDVYAINYDEIPPGDTPVLIRPSNDSSNAKSSVKGIVKGVALGGVSGAILGRALSGSIRGAVSGAVSGSILGGGIGALHKKANELSRKERRDAFESKILNPQTTKDYARTFGMFGAGIGAGQSLKKIIEHRKEIGEMTRHLPGGRKAAIVGLGIDTLANAALLGGIGAGVGAATGTFINRKRKT